MNTPSTMHAPNVLLTGFRATGKSYVGELLAQDLHYDFIDADVVLCQRQGLTVSEIVARYGWPEFRRLEEVILLEMAAREKTVLAVGGGAIEHVQVWPRLRESYFVVWLRAKHETICQRMAGDQKSSAQRPALLGNSAEEEVRQLLEKRMPLYAAGSDYAIDTDTLTAGEIVAHILRQFRVTI